MLTRRGLITRLPVFLAAPAIIRVADIMPIKVEPKLITRFYIPSGIGELNYHVYVTGSYLHHTGTIEMTDHVMDRILSCLCPA